jgi:hypothetical protein
MNRHHQNCATQSDSEPESTCDCGNNFHPSLRNVSGNMWEATIRLPVVGDVTTSGNGWEEAKSRLFIISKAVEFFRKKTN